MLTEHAYATMAATGLYFVAMNYTVHAIMSVLLIQVCLSDLGIHCSNPGVPV
jgi:hypothetical protein